MRNLFEIGQSNVEAEQPIPVRPLGPVSDLAVALPLHLDAIKKGRMEADILNMQATHSIRQLPPDHIASVVQDPDQLKVAVLDAMMIRAGLVHSGTAPDYAVVELGNTLSKASDQLPVISYQSYIFDNPPHDRRTFSAGAAAVSEGQFQEGHTLIELDHLQPTITALLRAAVALETQGREGISAASLALQRAADHMRPTPGYMKQFKTDFNPAHFAEFRPFVATDPITGLNGASGAFSARMPTVELLAVGRALIESHRAYADKHMLYFPSDGRKSLQNALAAAEAGKSILDYAAKFGDPDDLIDPLADLYSSYFDLTSAHYGATAAQIPEVVRGNKEGTAGTNAKQFLIDRIQLRNALIQQRFGGRKHR